MKAAKHNFIFRLSSDIGVNAVATFHHYTIGVEPVGAGFCWDTADSTRLISWSCLLVTYVWLGLTTPVIG